MIVVSDTTPIISLLKIGHLSLLKDLFQMVYVPRAVYRELTVNDTFADEAELVKKSTYIQQVEVINPDNVTLLQRATGLDIGESEAIIYSDENSNSLLLMDEAKGRAVASQMGIRIMGTIGLLLLAYQKSLLSSDEIITCIDELQKNNRHISSRLYQQLIREIKN